MDATHRISLRRNLFKIGLFSVLVSLVPGTPAFADDDFWDVEQALALSAEPMKLAQTPAKKDDGWVFIARFGLWAMNVNADVGFRDLEADFNLDFWDLIDHTNFAFMPGVEVHKDRWAVALNGIFSQLEADKHFTQTLPRGRVIEGGADITVDMYVGDLAIGYRLFDIPLAKDTGKDMVLSITPAVGVRYTHFKVEIDPERFDSRSRSANLWDPYVGGQVNLQITDKLAWRTDGTIGGFGVGSDIAWAAQTFLDWRFAKHVELNIGYRAMYWDYDHDQFDLDLLLHGPWIGVSFIWD